MRPPFTESPVPSGHTLSVADLCARLQSSPAGLTGADGARRLTECGPNELPAARRISPWAILLEQFQHVLIVLLLMATALSAVLGHALEAVAIAVLVLFSVLLGFAQEYRAERALEALQQLAAPTATVLRDGEEIALPARDLVPGDVVVLRAGHRVPADGRVIEATNLKIQEAALTGESVPVAKHAAALGDPTLALGDRLNMAYAGTVVTYGRGRALIVATGTKTEFGAIAEMLQTVDADKTPLQKNLDRVGGTLAQVALVVVALIVALGLWRGQPFVEMLVIGIALAVAVVPEALPAVVTISLAIGVQRLVKRGALIRRLSVVEALGSSSVICSDKTGTLTRDEMTVRRLYLPDQQLSVSGTGYDPRGEFSRDGVTVEPTGSLRRLLQAAALASDAHVVHHSAAGRWQVIGDPTEGALVVAAAKAGLWKTALDAQFPRTSEIPFDSATRRMTTLHAVAGDVTAFAKGAPEVILDSCNRQWRADGDVLLDAASRTVVLATARDMAGAGLRVLAVSVKEAATLDNAERDMTFLGLVGMIDPPRPEAVAAIRTCGQAGIRVVMMTGDHPMTAEAVARELGLLTTGRVTSGVELDAMSEAECEREVDHIAVYARVSPVHKLRVITVLQKKGHIVAMTGDGVNDAPALKKADIGIAMGMSGTDVAKEAAAMTLTNDDFAAIVAAVEEGRGIFGNIKKYLMFLLSSNVGEIGLMAGAALLGLPLPLTAVQILYVNLATDGLPALALAIDPPEPDLMRRQPRNPRTGIFTRPVLALTMAGGLWSTLVNVGLFAWALSSGRPAAEAMTLTFVSLVLIQFVKAYNYRSDRLSVLNRPFANRWLNRAIGWELVLLLVIVYLPSLHGPFGTASLTVGDWVVVVGLALTIAPVLETAKWMARREWFGQLA